MLCCFGGRYGDTPPTKTACAVAPAAPPRESTATPSLHISRESATAKQPSTHAVKESSAPWKDSKDLTELLARISSTKGPWLNRLQFAVAILAEVLGPCLVSFWGISPQPRSSAVVAKRHGLVMASAGAHRHLLAQGHLLEVPWAARSEPRADARTLQLVWQDKLVDSNIECEALQHEAVSLAHVLASEAPLFQTAPVVGSKTGGSTASVEQVVLPMDWAALAAAGGFTDFAALPVRQGAGITGVLMVCLRRASSSRQHGQRCWMASHLDELQQLALFVAAGCLGPDPSGATSAFQRATELTSSLASTGTVQAAVQVLMASFASMTQVRFGVTLTPRVLLLHRTGTVGAIFEPSPHTTTHHTAAGSATAATATASMDHQNYHHHKLPTARSSPTSTAGQNAATACTELFAGLEGSLTGRAGSGLRAISGEGVRARVVSMAATLLLQVTTLMDTRGQVVSDCLAYMQDEYAPTRDISLCHKVGLPNLASMVVAAGVLPSGEPLLGLYLCSTTQLPNSVLEDILQEVNFVIRVVLPVLDAHLQGPLQPEWQALHNGLLHPNTHISNAATLLTTPRSSNLGAPTSATAGGTRTETIVRSGIGLGAGLGGASLAGPGNSHCPKSGAGMMSALHSNNSLLPAYSRASKANSLLDSAMLTAPPSNTSDNASVVALTGRNTATAVGGRALSFAVDEPSTPRSALGLMVNSIRSSINAVLAQKALTDSDFQRDDISSVELLKQIGQGGQGVVFYGHMHGLEVAIKVVGTEEQTDMVYELEDEGLALKMRRVLKRDATELAVTTTVSHPNIVQMFNYFTDVMVVEYAGEPEKFKLMSKFHEAAVQGPTNMIIAMEYCDAGALKQAVRSGCFRLQTPSPQQHGGVAPALQVNLVALYMTLLELALAIRHLHSLRLVHCDIKPSNVLLRSSARDPRGWTAKLSDFGCVRLLSESTEDGRPIFNLDYAVGTPTHMAPEMFCKGHPLDTQVDIYSFGIMMWELLVGAQVYEGILNNKLPFQVVKRGLRPAFPADTPSSYRSLACACWSSDPRQRPTAAALVNILQRLLARAQQQQAAAQA